MDPRAAPDVEALYAAPLERFVAERDHVAADLAAGGHKDAAKAVKALRKPSVTAWTLNQLARGHASLLRELFSTGERMRDALDAGDQEGAREAQTARRAGLKEAGDRAREILEDAGHAAAAHVERVRSVLLRATTDEDVANAILEGRLGKEPEADALPDVFGGGIEPAVSAEERPAGSRRVEKLERRVAELRAEAEEATQRASRLARDAESARLAADAAEENAAAAQRAAERALNHLETAEAELDEARG